MSETDLSILEHLAYQGYLNATSGQLICMLNPEEQLLYKKLHQTKLIKTKKTCVGRTYRLSKKGWKSLSSDKRQSILDDYYQWVNFINPTIDQPRWIKWVKQ